VSIFKQLQTTTLASSTLPSQLPELPVTGMQSSSALCMTLVESLPTGICIIGDAAYQPTKHMVPVYQGIDKLNTKYNNFNFFASQ
jgi:hypothetical protein